MGRKLTAIVVASIVTAMLVYGAVLAAALYAAYHLVWLHPAVATTAAIPLGLGLGAGVAHIGWWIGDRVEPYRGEYLNWLH